MNDEDLFYGHQTKDNQGVDGVRIYLFHNGHRPGEGHLRGDMNVCSKNDRYVSVL